MGILFNNLHSIGLNRVTLEMLIIKTFLIMLVVAMEGVISDSRLSFGYFSDMKLDDTLSPMSISVITDFKRMLRNFPEKRR